MIMLAWTQIKPANYAADGNMAALLPQLQSATG